MCIIITPVAAERLAVSGDFETELAIPFESDEDRFHLAFSDGTLIAGEHDPDDDTFHYQVEVEGAGMARIDGAMVSLDCRAEWLTIATYRADAVPVRPVEPLPLFEAN